MIQVRLFVKKGDHIKLVDGKSCTFGFEVNDAGSEPYICLPIPLPEVKELLKEITAVVLEVDGYKVRLDCTNVIDTPDFNAVILLGRYTLRDRMKLTGLQRQ